MLILALAEEASHVAHASDFEETLIPIAIAMAGIALAYAAVATWIVTPKAGH